MLDDSSSRRRFLNKVSALAVFGAAATGVTRADDSGLDTRSAKNAGIDETVTNLVDEGKFELARRLLERHGVTHAFGRDTHVEPADEDGVSTSDFAIKSRSHFLTTAWVSGSEEFDGTEHDIVTVHCVWYPEFAKDIDAPAPIDVASVYWEANVFGLVTGSLSHGGYLDFGGDREYGVTNVVSPNLDDGTEGVTVGYDDTVTRSASGNNPAVLYPQEGRGFMEVKLRRQIDSYGNLRMEYGHNWSIGGRSWDPSNVTLNIGSHVSYDLPRMTDNWTMDEKKDI